MKNRNKKVASIVLNNFKNDSRVLKESISLQNAGYGVKVVALWEDGVDEFERVSGIDVHRVKLISKNWSKNIFVQIIKYLEFVYRVSSRYRDIDIAHCNDLDALLVGVLIKKFYNRDVKIVYDAHEHESYRAGYGKLLQRLSRWWESRLIGYADVVITVSPSIADEYVLMYGIKRPALVLNAPEYKEVQSKNFFREEFDINDEKTIFLYQGGLSRGRGIEILLETFKTINDPNIIIIFMGYGILKDKIIKASQEYSNIYFHKAVSPDILLDYTSGADFGISTIEDSCLSYRYCLPNKMFEYLMANIPIIVSNLPEMKKIIEKYKVGIVVKENTVQGLIQAIQEAVSLDKIKLQKNIQEIKDKYNWQEQERVLLSCYDEILE